MMQKLFVLSLDMELKVLKYIEYITNIMYMYTLNTTTI